MYEVQFVTTSSADWAEAIHLIDDDTNQPLDLTGLTFELGVEDNCRALLSASSDAGTIITPGDGVVEWVFPQSQMGALRRRKTYQVGLVCISAGGRTQILIGSLAFIDGEVP